MSLYYNTCSYVHEVILHVDAENLVMSPQTDGQAGRPASESWRTSTIRMDLLFGCMESTKAFLGYYLGLSQSELERITIMDFSRLTYNLLVLGKLCLGSGLGSNDATIQWSASLVHYFALIDTKLNGILVSQGGIPERNVYFHFKKIFNTTRSWFEDQIKRGSNNLDQSSARGDPRNLDLLQIMDKYEPEIHHESMMDDMDFTLTSQDAFWDEMMVGWPANLDTPAPY